MYCTNCGAQIPDNSKFCPVCGSEVKGASVPSSPSPAPEDESQAEPTAQTAPEPAAPATPQPASQPTPQPEPQPTPQETASQQPTVVSAGAAPTQVMPTETLQTPPAPPVPPEQAPGTPAGGSPTPPKKPHGKLIAGLVIAAIVVVALVAFGIGAFTSRHDADVSEPTSVDEPAETEDSEPADSSEIEHGYDDMGDGADAKAFRASSSGSYARKNAPVEGESVVQLDDTLYYVSDDNSSILSQPREGGDETTVYAIDESQYSRSVVELVTDGKSLYVATYDFDDGSFHVFELSSTGAASDDLITQSNSDTANSLELYVTKSKVGVVVGYYEGNDTDDSYERAYVCDKDGGSADEFDLESGAAAYSMGDDALYYMIREDSSSSYDQDVEMHRIDLDSGDDETVYSTSTAATAYGTYAGDGCGYMVFVDSSFVRIVGVGENGFEGAVDVDIPEYEGTDGSSFYFDSIYLDPKNGRVLVCGTYFLDDSSAVEAVVSANLDGSGAEVVTVVPNDPDGDSDSTFTARAMPCGKDIAIHAYYSNTETDYITGKDGSDLTQYHVYSYYGDDGSSSDDDLGDAQSA